MTRRTEATKRTSDRVAEHLISHIRKHRLHPGDALPSEVQVSVELGISRGIIREAYRSLDMAGILVATSGRAPRVGQLHQRAFTHVFEHALATQQVSPAEILEVRAPLEIRAAELAAVNRTEQDAEALVAHAAALRRAGRNLQAIIKADVDFHEVVSRATGNRLFGAVAGSLRESLELSMRAGLYGRSKTDLARVVEIHETIAQRIQAGDSIGARREMTRHFDDARVTMASSTRPLLTIDTAAPGRQRAD